MKSLYFSNTFLLWSSPLFQSIPLNMKVVTPWLTSGNLFVQLSPCTTFYLDWSIDKALLWNNPSNRLLVYANFDYFFLNLIAIMHARLSYMWCWLDKFLQIILYFLLVSMILLYFYIIQWTSVCVVILLSFDFLPWIFLVMLFSLIARYRCVW